MSVLLITTWVVAVVDWARTDVVDVRTLPKGGWGLTLLILGPVGAVGWFVLGHPWKSRPR